MSRGEQSIVTKLEAMFFRCSFVSQLYFGRAGISLLLLWRAAPLREARETSKIRNW